MNEPRIQYAKTSDGVSIAFWTLGQGMALLDMPRVPFSHILLEWQIPEMRRWYEQLSEQTMLVRYDARGLGLSDRGVDDFTLDSLLLDVEAVADRLELNRFALLGNVISGAAAIAFAARFPERVSHLLLWSPCARRGFLCQSAAGVPGGVP
jgi:pimeloyl-ACP methyl ester carboxylesterase